MKRPVSCPIPAVLARLALLGLILASLTGCAGGIEMLNFGRKAPAPPPPTDIGRYQLAVSPKASGGSEIVKIDTQTGAIWILDDQWRKIPN